MTQSTEARASRAELERATVRFQRRMAASLVAAMAETGATFAGMAERLADCPDRGETHLRMFIHDLIEGAGGRYRMDMISDFCFAMDCEPEITLRRLTPDGGTYPAPQPESAI